MKLASIIAISFSSLVISYFLCKSAIALIFINYYSSLENPLTRFDILILSGKIVLAILLSIAVIRFSYIKIYS
jgi:hypothetical protein